MSTVQPDERRPFLWGFVAFFLLFFAWYTVRPVREAMGIQRGAGDLPGLMIATVVLTLITNPLLAKLAGRWPRAVLVRRIYRFLAWNLVAFHATFVFLPSFVTFGEDTTLWLGFCLYSWVSIFSVLIGSVLWSLLSEVFTPAQAKRLFGPLAAACSLGGLAGSAVAGTLATRLDEPLHMLLLAALLLELAAQSSRRLAAYSRKDEAETSSDGSKTGAAPLQVEGNPLTAGLRMTLASPYLQGIGGYVLLHTIVGTWVYLIQGTIIDALEADLGGDIQRFAWLDGMVNAASLVVQLFAVERIVRRIGIGWSLAGLPLVCTAGFAVLVVSPTYAVLAAFQTVRRTVNYGIAKPAREMLFAPLRTNEKYLAKNLIDLFLYRLGDSLGAVSKVLLAGTLGGMAGIAIPVCLAWATLGPWLGRRNARLERPGSQ